MILEAMTTGLDYSMAKIMSIGSSFFEFQKIKQATVFETWCIIL